MKVEHGWGCDCGICASIRLEVEKTHMAEGFLKGLHRKRADDAAKLRRQVAATRGMLTNRPVTAADLRAAYEELTGPQPKPQGIPATFRLVPGPTGLVMEVRLGSE